MKIVPWIVGLIMILLTVLAVMIIPADLPAPTERAAGPGAASPPSVFDPDKPVEFRVVWNAIEQISPIVGSKGTLVEAIGIETPGGVFTPIIRRGEVAPVTGTFTLATAVENQAEMLVHVCRGNAESASENESLGWYRIGGIPPGAASDTLITLVFRVADNAIVGGAVVPQTGQPLRFAQTTAPLTR